MKILEAVLFATLLTGAVAFIGGWWMMLAVGVAHHEWTTSIPMISYWSAVKLTAVCMIGITTGRARARFHN